MRRVIVTSNPSDATVARVGKLLSQAITVTGKVMAAAGKFPTEAHVRPWVDARMAEIQAALDGKAVADSTADMVAAAIRQCGGKATSLPAVGV